MTNVSDGAIVRLLAICARGFEGANGEELPPTELSLSRSALMDAQYAAKVEYDRMRAELSGARRAREKLEHYQVLASGYVGDEARGIERCAREILGAFDGE